MTDQRPPAEPATDDEIARPDPWTPGAPDADEREEDAKEPEEPNPLLRQGTDALDAADIEDPGEQL